MDEGTLCLNTCMAPASTGLAPLAVDLPLMTEIGHQAFPAVIYVALRQGARQYDLTLLQAKYLYWCSRSSQFNLGQGPPDETARSIEEDWTELIIKHESSSYDSLIRGEMERLPKDKESGLDDYETYRYHIRPLYFSFGYADPVSFLEKLMPYSLLGNKNVRTLIHEDLARILDQAPQILNSWAPGLASKTAQEVRSVNGLQIRKIANKEHLSNHAFGLAIDINAYGNPHVVGSEVIDVLNWVAMQAGVHFDFGQSILTAKERGHANYTPDDIMEIHNRVRPASNAVMKWLQRHLPRYKTLISDVRKKESALGVKGITSSTPLEDRSSKAVSAYNKLLRSRELASPNKVCEPLPDDIPKAVALRDFTASISQIAADEHLRRIQLLYEKFEDPKYIDTWEQQGIMTIPLFLAVALAGELGLRWGEQYESSKDAMHFELVAKDGGSYIKPDRPLEKGEKPRTLNRLKEEAFGPGWPNFKLTPPALLQRATLKLKVR